MDAVRVKERCGEGDARDDELEVVDAGAVLLELHRARVVAVEDDVEQGDAREVDRDLHGDAPLLSDARQGARRRDALGDLLKRAGRVERRDFLLDRGLAQDLEDHVGVWATAWCGLGATCHGCRAIGVVARLGRLSVACCATRSATVALRSAWRSAVRLLLLTIRLLLLLAIATLLRLAVPALLPIRLLLRLAVAALLRLLAVRVGRRSAILLRLEFGAVRVLLLLLLAAAVVR